MTVKSSLLPALHLTVNDLVKEFELIPSARKTLLAPLTEFIRKSSIQGLNLNLNFICTHNSRRSHIAQLWAQASAHYYVINNVHCFSGGTEATAFNPRAVKAMSDLGFHIRMAKGGDNPVFEVDYADRIEPIIAFSKTYDDPFNPEDFAAVMTCSHADEHCPLIPGALARFSVTYDDPKNFDGTPLEEAKYAERAREIGREMLYVFSKVN